MEDVEVIMVIVQAINVVVKKDIVVLLTLFVLFQVDVN